MNAKITRRLFLGTSGAACLLPPPASARTDPARSGWRLHYLRPAGNWNEALPVGNGRLGAMIFGRVAQERLQLNEETLWAGSPYTPDNPDALDAIPEVRRLLAAGDYKAAAALASARVMAKPLTQMAYGSLGDVLIDTGETEIPLHYERLLDLSTAISSMHYRTNAGEYRQEAFASAPDGVIVWRRRAVKGLLNIRVAHRAPREVRYARADYQGLATPEVAGGEFDWMAREPDTASGVSVNAASDGTAALLITGRNWGNAGVGAGLNFALRINIVSDGEVAIRDGRAIVSAAREVMLQIAAATSFVNFRDVSGDPVGKVRATTRRIARKSFDALERSHVREYSALYDGASLELESAEKNDAPTDVRIANAEQRDDPAFAALYFQYARYLMISSSRPGCQPANLQGIWNEGINPPWGSKYTININTEMNYWAADPAGLSACVEPLLRMVEDLAVSGAATSATMYGARGWVAHHNTDLWRAAAPIDGPMWGLWPCGGAWLCNTLWDHYDYTRDLGTLKRLYPLMHGAAMFFLDTLIDDPQHRGLITSPSLSPENLHPFGAALCAGPAMDRQILRDLFEHTIESGRILGINDPLLEQFAQARDRLAPDVVGKGGQLQEWLEDWDDQVPEPHHRHVSHLYAVYPSSQINPRDTPKLVDAAKRSLENRGDLATGWGTAWRLCLWARMGDAERAHQILKALLGPQRTYPNMFDAHPPFQIDGNFGGSAGILEMLVQSWGNEVRLLPALPEAWSAGRVRGIRVRGGLRVDMRWQSHKIEWFEISGPPRAEVHVRVDDQLNSIVLSPRGRYRYTRKS
ncbi:MAG: glycoside hydrolase family 95 protein [Pseudomonadota bacterium]